MSNLLPRPALLTAYRSFARPHLDYGDVLYDQRKNDLSSDKTETVQYDASLDTRGAIRWVSKENLYQGLGLESLKSRR